MKTLRHALVFISALLGTSSLHAAPGDLDLSFGGGGKVTTAIGTGGDFGYSVIQQADGKLVVAGTSYNGSNDDFALARYNANGTLDTGFDGDGKVITDMGSSYDYGSSVIQQVDGKLVVAGTSNNDFALARYNADGSLDTSFDGDGKVTTAIGASTDVGYSVIQQADGKLVVAGYSWNGSSYDFALVRYNADGSLDASFDGDGIVTTAIGAANDYAQSVIQQADGKLVVAGYSWNGSNDDVALVRYNTDGSLDTGFDGDGKVTTAIGTGYDEGYSVIQQADGKLVVAGTSYNGSSNDFALVRYNADGSLDASFDGDGIVTTAIGAGDDYGRSVIQQADGKLVVAGSSWNGSNNDVALVRYNEDGSLDTSFDGDGKVTTAIGAGDDFGRSVIQQADGKLVVAGHSSNGNNYDVALVRYDSGQLITTTNLWLKKLATKVGAGSNDDRWSAQYLYNADRRSGQVFDPANDALNVALAG
jgi:uncharacterized delta-60 repeat protein